MFYYHLAYAFLSLCNSVIGFCFEDSHVLCLVCAGAELRAAGQVRRSQTDAGEAGHPAACCQKHVQADGLSAQQDAFLQCKQNGCSYSAALVFTTTTFYLVSHCSLMHGLMVVISYVGIIVICQDAL